MNDTATFRCSAKIPTTDAKELFHICSYCNHNPLSHMLRKTRLITCFIIRYFEWDQRSTMLQTHTKYSTKISRFGIFPFKLSITWALLLMRSSQFCFFVFPHGKLLYISSVIFIGDSFSYTLSTTYTCMTYLMRFLYMNHDIMTNIWRIVGRDFILLL